MAGIVSPDELRSITADLEMKEARKHLEKKRREEEEHRAARAHFMTDDIPAAADERISARVRQAAENGLHEIMVFSFASDLLADRGRAINNFDASWPQSLTGVAKKAYDYFEEKLKPQGYKLRMQIINYPGGMPGDVGVFLSW